MRIELTEDSKYRSKKTKFRDVADQGEVIYELDEEPLYKYSNRLANKNMVWRIPLNWKYTEYEVYYEIGSDIPVVDFFK